jgi:hypothetical protein
MPVTRNPVRPVSGSPAYSPDDLPVYRGGSSGPTPPPACTITLTGDIGPAFGFAAADVTGGNSFSVTNAAAGVYLASTAFASAEVRRALPAVGKKVWVQADNYSTSGGSGTNARAGFFAFTAGGVPLTFVTINGSTASGGAGAVAAYTAAGAQIAAALLPQGASAYCSIGVGHDGALYIYDPVAVSQVALTTLDAGFSGVFTSDCTLILFGLCDLSGGGPASAGGRIVTNQADMIDRAALVGDEDWCGNALPISLYDPSVIFVAGVDGAYFDPSDMATLFQDSAGTTPVTEFGQPVGLMLDKSGNGRHATQSSNSLRPIVHKDSLGAYLVFNGTDRFMQFPAPDQTDEYTIFAVGIPVNAGAGNQGLLGDNTTFSSGSVYFRSAAGAQAAGTTFNTSALIATGYNAARFNRNALMLRSKISAARDLRINNIQNITGTTGATTVSGRTFNIGNVGGIGFLNGRFHGGVVVNRVLTLGQCESLDSWAAAKSNYLTSPWSAFSSNFRDVGWMSSDGVELWNFNSTVFSSSIDGGNTWRTVTTFGSPVNGVRQLPSGELLVSLQISGAPGEVHRSNGYDRVTGTVSSWTKVLDCSANDVYIQGQWGMWIDPDVIILGEYGSKAGSGLNARYVYRSTDGGTTWDIIFDWNGAGRHVHGVAYDKYRDRVWVTLGDSPNQGVQYSDDWDQPTPTWTVLSSNTQPVGIWPMPDAVVFGTDDAANGVRRWRASDGDYGIAVNVDPLAGTLTHIGGQLFRRSDSHPLLIPIGPVPGQTGTSQLWITHDGLSYSRVWIDVQETVGKSLDTSVGPGTDGVVYGSLRSDRQAAASVLRLYDY